MHPSSSQLWKSPVIEVVNYKDRIYMCFHTQEGWAVVWEKHVGELPVSLVSWCTRSPLTILLLNILLSGIRPHVQTFSLGNMASVCHYSQAIQISSPHKAPFCNTDHRPWLQPGEWSGSKQMFLCLRLLIFLFGSIFLFCLLFKHYKKFKRKNSETWGMKIYYS